MNAEDFWQQIEPAESAPPAAPFGEAYPARLPDGRHLLLPIRPLGDSGNGLASLIINQASFAVLDVLATQLAELLRPAGAEIVAGLPTLGLTLASAVAERLGHPRYVALGTSRKFWYDDGLSVPLSSITTPDGKRLFLDPRLRPLLEGRRVLLIDDVISTGSSIAAGLMLLRQCGVEPVAIGAAMLQTGRWRERLGDDADLVRGLFTTPLLERTEAGWEIATG